MTIAEILEKEDVKEFDDEIRYMPKKLLIAHFSYKSNPGRVNPTKLIKNLIWQAYTLIRDGKREKIGSNIRGFWYTDVKAPLSRVGLSTHGRKYTRMLYVSLHEFVVKYRLFNYWDFGFTDETWSTKYIGQTNPHVILFVEKDGLYQIVKGIAKEFDCVAASTGGFPSVIGSEYLVRRIAAKAPLRQKFHIASVVDYDPSGWTIEKEFIEQLKAYDLSDVTIHPLIRPARLTSKRIEFVKYSLKKSKRTDEWVKISGGLNGKAYGIEANAFTQKEVRDIFLKEVGKFLKPVIAVKENEQDKIYNRLDGIEKTMKEMMKAIGEIKKKVENL